MQKGQDAQAGSSTQMLVYMSHVFCCISARKPATLTNLLRVGITPLARPGLQHQQPLGLRLKKRAHLHGV